MKRTTATVAVVVGVAIFAVAAYVGVWWIRRDSVNRAAEIRQETFGRQNALVELILDDIREAERAGVPAAQRIAIVDIVCDNAALLTGSITLPPNASAFVAKECS